MKKKQSHWDRMRPTKKNNKIKVLTMNSEYSSNIKKIKEIDNPFNKVIDRHFGCFKCRILGNYKNVFNSLDFDSLEPFGNKGSVKRKVLRHEKFTAIFYCSKNRGSVELKIPRLSLSHKQAHEALFNQYYQCAVQARDILEKYYHLPLSIPVQNRLAKYGVEDLAARAVNLEIHGKHRIMDASNRLINGKFVRNRPHLDHKGVIAAKAAARLSDKQHDLISTEIAKSQGFKDVKSFEFRKAKGIAHLQAPELLISIENALLDLGQAQREGLEIQREGNELAKFYAENNAAHVAGVVKLGNGVEALPSAVQAAVENSLLKLLRPKRLREFKTSFKKSASVRSCS